MLNKQYLWKNWRSVHFGSFVKHIGGAKFQEHCFNISRDIIYSVFYHFFSVSAEGIFNT